MLEELEIRSLGPIRQARIAPNAGMNAITGETGAGKSMLLNAVELISGASAQPQRVSADSESAWVQAIFDVSQSPHIQQIATDAGTKCVDGQLFINRTVPKTGRSRAVLNGQTVPRTVLTSLSSELVTIHGQSEQLKIASSAKQREFLDSFAGNDLEREVYARIYTRYCALQAKIDQLKSAQTQAIAQIDYLKDAIERIDKVNPHTGEDEELKEQRAYIENAAQIAMAQSAAMQALDSSDDGEQEGVSALLSRAIHELHSVENIDKISEIISRLESANDEIQDIIFALSQTGSDDVDPRDLDTINERIYELDELTKRWGPTLKDVLDWKEKAQFELEDLDASPERIEELENQLKLLKKQMSEAASTLRKTRESAAMLLSSGVTDELKSLAMEGSQLIVSVREQDKFDAYGADVVSFEFIPFPGSAPLPLGKSASGGELSRLMLAMELVAFEKRHGESSGQADVPTLIFDEIDAGVGGKAANELGKRLARLARGAQVIVVTHLPQVAAWANAQFVVAKTKTDTSATTSVTRVEGEKRVEEIARMLAGSLTDMSQQHAAELLDECTLQ